jgi:8-oxo-dGTP pyrophosphatase MutT (NUDIX family)
MTDLDVIPAATVIVMREGDGAPEVLMLERAAGMAFAGGALVFPGGRIDPGDHALAAQLGSDDRGEAAARIAAIRETIEEAGIAIGMAVPAADLETIRAALHDGTAIGELWSAPIDLAALVPFARWIPRELARRRFDTRFYLARLPEGAPKARADAGENVRLFWACAADVLAEADAGRVSLIFPTRRNLERLARFLSYEEAVADARAHALVPITPAIERRGGVDHLCIPEGLGYPVTAEPLESVRRG